MVEEEKEAEISAQGSCGAEEGSLTSQRKKKRRRDRVRLQEGSRIREPGTGDPESEPFTNNDTQAPGSKPSVTMLGIGSAFDLVRKVSDKMSSKKQEHPLKRRASRRARVGSVRRSSTRNRRQSSVRSGSQSSNTGSICRRPNGQLSQRRLVLDLRKSVDHGGSGSNAGSSDKGLEGRTSSDFADAEAGDVFMPSKTTPKTVKDHLVGMFSRGWQQIRVMVGLRNEEIITVQEIIKEPLLEELELPHRYRPENLQLLCEATGFSVVEMKRIYRGFKTECPTGLITEETFHGIYSRFFPQGAQFEWKDISGKVRSSVKPPNVKMSKKERKEVQKVQNTQASISSYSHYIFATLDHEDTGVITFEDFVIGLSILVRGSVEEKARWMFTLYDQDRDGYISREEMEDVVGSVFDLMGRTSDPIMEEEVINKRVDHLFERMDLNGDGVVSQEEFLETCLGDEHITRSIIAFSNVII